MSSTIEITEGLEGSVAIDARDSMSRAPSCRSTVIPGTRLQGIATYHPLSAKQCNVKCVTLTISGMIKITHVPQTTQPDKGCIRLFEKTIQLFQGPRTVVAGTKIVWPWEFDIPTHTEYVRSIGRIDKTRVGEAGVERILFELPPSLAQVVVNYVVAEIKYSLVMRVECSGFFSKNVEIERVLNMRPRSQLAPAAYSGLSTKPSAVEFKPKVTWTSDKLLPTTRSSGWTSRFKNSKDDRGGSKVPCLAFTALLYAPKTVNLGHPFELRFAVRHEQNIEHDPVDRRLEIERVKTTLSFRIEIAGLASGSCQKENNLIWEKRFGKSEAVVDQSGLKIPCDGSSTTMMEDLRINEFLYNGADFAHSFDTPLVKGGYQLTVETVVRHIATGRMFMVYVQVPVEVLDSRFGAAEGGLFALQTAQHVDGCQLPAYTAERVPEFTST